MRSMSAMPSNVENIHSQGGLLSAKLSVYTKGSESTMAVISNVKCIE